MPIYKLVVLIKLVKINKSPPVYSNLQPHLFKSVVTNLNAQILFEVFDVGLVIVWSQSFDFGLIMLLTFILCHF